MKKGIRTLVLTLGCMLAVNITAYAGAWEQDAVGWRYKMDDGTYARNTQLWLDGDNDDLYQSFDFDLDGYCYINSRGHGDREYNENGEWIYNGVVQTEKRSDRTYDNWLEIMLQADAFYWRPYSELQAAYGQPQSCCIDDLLWKTGTYRFENSPLDYRFEYNDQTGPGRCDLATTTDSFVPDGVTIRDLKNALGVDIICRYSAMYKYGEFESESYSYSLNYGPNSWTFSVKDGAESLDVPLELTSFTIYPFSDDAVDGTVSDTRDVMFGMYSVIKVLR